MHLIDIRTYFATQLELFSLLNYILKYIIISINLKVIYSTFSNLIPALSSTPKTSQDACPPFRLILFWRMLLNLSHRKNVLDL